jgi:hypothetical protein
VVTLRVFLLGRKALFFAPSANFRFALHPRHHNSEAEHENKHRSGSKTTLASAPCSWRQSTVARRVKGCRICRRRNYMTIAPSANFRFALRAQHHNSEAGQENKRRSGSKISLALPPCSWRQSTVARRVKGCRICRRRNYMTIAPSANFRFALRAQHHNSEAVHESSRRKLIRHFKNSEINFRPLTPTDGRFAYHGCSIETLGSFFL